MLDFNDAKPLSYFERVPLEAEEYPVEELAEVLRDQLEPLLKFLFLEDSLQVHGDYLAAGSDGPLVLMKGPCRGDFFPPDLGYIGSPLDLVGFAKGLDRPDSAAVAKDFLDALDGPKPKRLSLAQLYNREAGQIAFYEDIRNLRIALPAVGDLSLEWRGQGVRKPVDALAKALQSTEVGPDVFSIGNPDFDEMLYNVALEAPANHIPIDAHQMRADRVLREAEKVRWAANEFWTRPKTTKAEYDASTNKRILLRSTVGSGKTSIFLKALAENVQSIRGQFDRCVHIDVLAPTHQLLDEIEKKLSEFLTPERVGELAVEVVHIRRRNSKSESGVPYCQRDSDIMSLVYDAQDPVANNFCEREMPLDRSSDASRIGVRAEEGTYCKLPLGARHDQQGSAQDLRKFERCRFHHVCPYVKQFERAKLPGRDIVIRLITHQAASYTSPFGMPPADYVVVDEDPSSAFVSDDQKMKFGFSLFEQAHMGQKFDESVRPDLDHETDIKEYNRLLGEVEVAFRIALREVRTSVSNHCSGSNWAKADWDDHLQQILSQNSILRELANVGISRYQLVFLHDMDRSNIIPSFGNPCDAESEIVKNQPKHNLTSRRLCLIWRALLVEEGVAQQHSRQLSFVVEVDGTYRARVESKFVLTIWNRENNPTLTDPVSGNFVERGRFSGAREKLALLDATANSDALLEIFGPLETVVAEFPHNAKVFIDQSKSYSKTALIDATKGKSIRKAVWATIDKITNALGTDGFVVSPKAGKQALLTDRRWRGGNFVQAEETLGGVSFLHFGAERGLDRYRDADWGLIVGGLRLNELGLYRQVRSLFAREEVDVIPGKIRFNPESSIRVPPSVGRGLVDRKSIESIRVTGFEDPRLQRAHIAAYEASITQAAGRLRTVHSSKRRHIFILAAGVSAEFPGDWVADEESGGENRSRTLAAEYKFWETLAVAGGVFILQKDWMHALAPSQFSTTSAAKDWLKNHGDKFRGEPPINRLYIEGPPLNEPPGSDHTAYWGRVKLRRDGDAGTGRPPGGDLVAIAGDVHAARLAIESAAIAGGFRVVSLTLEGNRSPH